MLDNQDEIGKLVQLLKDLPDDAVGFLGQLPLVTYLHLPIVAGPIAVAVAGELVIAHPSEALHGGELVVLAIGPLLVLLGTVAALWRATRVVPPRRVLAAAVIAAVAVSGLFLPALATWAAVLAVLVLVLAAVERRAITESVRRRMM